MRDDELAHLCADIARLVMGWTATDIPWAYDAVTPVWHTADGDPIMTVFSWRPDRNDSQNMQVLERLIDLGFELTLTAGEESTVVEISRGSKPIARGQHRSRRIVLLHAALQATTAIRSSRFMENPP